MQPEGLMSQSDFFSLILEILKLGLSLWISRALSSFALYLGSLCDLSHSVWFSVQTSKARTCICHASPLFPAALSTCFLKVAFQNEEGYICLPCKRCSAIPYDIRKQGIRTGTWYLELLSVLSKESANSAAGPNRAKFNHFCRTEWVNVRVC